MKYQCSSGGHWLSYFHFPGGRQQCTQGTEPSAPTSSMDCGFNLEPAIKLRAPMKQQRALPTSGHQCPQQQKVHQVYCHYQVYLITAITGSQGRAARHLLFKGKKAAQSTPATVNTSPAAESLELNNNFENAHLFLPDHTMHTGTYADPIAMVSTASPFLRSDQPATQSKHKEI